MRALGLTLVLVAAIAASLTVARQRQPERRPGSDVLPEPSATIDSEAEAELEAIRAAGL